MKIVLGCLGIAFALYSANAQFFTFTPNSLIPDPLVSGLQDTRSVSTPTTAIGDLNVKLTITGDSTAANGDFYVTLTHGSGFAVLLNRVGRRSGESAGYPDNGFDVTFDDEASNGDIHVYRFKLFGDNNVPVDVNYENPLTGSWAADGRDVLPSVALDTSTRIVNPLSAFDLLDPNGDWILFVADLAAGGSAILASWSLEITPVPEPASMGFVVGSLLILCALGRRVRSIEKGSPPHA